MTRAVDGLCSHFCVATGTVVIEKESWKNLRWFLAEREWGKPESARLLSFVVAVQPVSCEPLVALAIGASGYRLLGV